MKKRKRIRMWPVIYGIMLTAYAVFTLLDAFVIPQNIVSPGQTGGNSETHSEPPEFSDNTGMSEPVITENSYVSGDISITISELARYDTRVYVADVVLKDPAYLKTGLAEGTFGRNISDTTSSIAEDSGAILAVNGDYYGFRDRGFVMRNGYLYRETAQRGNDQEDLIIYGDGAMEIVEESASDALALAEAGAAQIFSFGPGLLQNGEITVNEGDEVEQAMRSNPRTAVGEIEPLHYVFVVSDGRTRESAGLTLYELAQVMRELGCRTAYNLDGGGSSTMWFMGKIINHPTDGRRDGERRISDIVYIGE